MSEIVWGADIPVDGKRPEFLRYSDRFRWYSLHMGDGWWDQVKPGYTTGREIIWGENITAIRLPADHPHYKQGVPANTYEDGLRDALDVIQSQAVPSMTKDYGMGYHSALQDHIKAIRSLISVDPDVAVVRAVIGAWFNMEEGYDSYHKGRFQRALAAYKATKGGEG